MARTVIEIEGLRKEYRTRWARTKIAAVDGLDLAVPEGGVFGFLGPNGSGKTTTIRCLLGLVRPTGGRAAVFGIDVTSGLHPTVRRVGSIVETPAFFPTMSGRKNLLLLAAVDKIGRQRVDDVLDRVGLADRAGDLVRRYSLGMRQRLGLAAALLKDPALLIFDEPANGLDPAGIREIRELMRGLGREGRTVFVSSHLLSEVEQTCDAVAILAKGRCVVAGPVHEVLGGEDGGALVVRVDDLASATATLLRAGIPAERRDEHLRVMLPPEAAARVTEVLGREGLWVTELRLDEARLEDMFLELTGGDALEEAPT